MKKQSILAIGAAFGLLLFATQCDKNAPEAPSIEPYPETNLEASAGTWKTYMSIDDSKTVVPTPEAAGSSAYQAELTQLKSTMAGATAEQKELALFWGSNGVTRWHEIARELAANYNVPPNYNADGTYPAPDPANPTAYPRFPFANPPVASRMFALLGVAQYDALVACWKRKFEHNRLAPYKNASDIQPLIPTNDLPSYPSEDAVVAAASREILKFIFPGEVSYINDKAEEHKNSRLWAGANVQSDLSAGDSLGRIVAQYVINEWAKKDKMGQANNQAAYPNLKADANARGISVLWTSRDIPSRPPMLPFFGNVKTWNFDDATKIALRPPVPPQPGSAEFEAAMDELRDIAKNRTREQQRITAYWADGAGSYTPPGHWNRKACELILEKQFNEIRSARAMALVGTAVVDAGITCWDVKYYYLLPRPTEMDPDVTTGTGIPNFPAYTSGHSTFSGAAVEVLSYLFPDHKSELEAMAKEASESRIYGCIHYRFDCEVGLEVGKKVGEYAVTRGRNDGSE
ncbi:MAG TPA: vanadium-dependent haloperoxidase [Saprospiraceae bacterium]|nr:vanadium-dependent haloperoxidase [Saprospiraceae bacterium]